MNTQSRNKPIFAPKLLVVVTSLLLVLILLIALCIPLGLRIICKPSVTNQLLSRYVPQYVGADVSVEQMNVRLFSTFPEAELELLRPLVRVAVPDSMQLLGSRCPFPHNDTLFAADTLRVRLHLPSLKDNQVKIQSLLISRPELYLTQYDSTANYAIIMPRDTQPSASLRVVWQQVNLTDGTVGLVSDSLGIRGITLDSVCVYSDGQFADSLLAAYIDASLCCEDARMAAKGYLSDSVDMQASLFVPHVERLLALLPEAVRQKTIKQNELRGGVQLDAAVKGNCAEGRPSYVHACVRIDSLHGGHPHRAVQLDDLSLRAEANYDANNPDSTFVRIDTLSFHSGESFINAYGLAGYRRKKEWLQLNLQSDLHLRELIQLAELEEKVRVRGCVRANMETQFYLDDLLQQRVQAISSYSTIKGDGIFLAIPEARLRFVMDSLRAELNTNQKHLSRRTNEEKNVLLNMRVSFRQLSLKHKRSTNATIDRTTLRVYADELTDKAPPVLHSSLSLQGVQAQLFDTIHLQAKRMRVSAGMHPAKDATFVPTTTARISADSALLANPNMGALFDSLRINLNTTPRYMRYHFDRQTRTRTLIPDSTRVPMAIDSLLRLATKVVQDSTPIEQFVRLFRTAGQMDVRRMSYRLSNMPLRTSVSRMSLSLNDDTVQLNSFRLRVGRSAISLQGEVSNLRRHLLRGKTLEGNLRMHSRRIDLNQLVNAMNQRSGTAYHDSIDARHNVQELAMSGNEDRQGVDSLQTDTLQSRLLVMPANMHVTLNASVDTIIFSAMRLNNFVGKVYLNDHTLSATNVSTSTKVGRMGVDVRYTCRDTTEALAAASLVMDSVQIGDLVKALPELETIMPMLSSFEGSVTSEAAVQLRLRSDLDVDLSSVNAGVWLQGRNLVLMDGETFSEIAKQLMFSKKTRNLIDSLSVEVLVKNNEVEIFPFMLSLDKYRAGVGGKMLMNGGYNYHITVFKPIKLGLDVYADETHKTKFKLVHPKYQNATSKIGKGGMLLKEQDANVIPAMQKTIQSFIRELSK